MEYLVLGIFCAGLLLCVVSGLSILYALLFGLLLFMLYGKRQGFSWHVLFSMALNGVRTVHNILVTFLLIGILTALWRAAGTIPYIVCHASKLCLPSVFLLMTFLLNSGLSVLTGTSFGTAATMGVICATMGAAMDISPVLTGGAVLSGAFFGDRCSPVSTSALLVAELTGTDIYDNIHRMLRTAFFPFSLSCLIYLVLGLLVSQDGAVINLDTLYSHAFHLNWITITPAIAILLLSLLRVSVKVSMSVSILTAIAVCIFVQGSSLSDVLKIAVAGFHPEEAEVAATVSGGGIVSMLKVACIVCISSSYSDLFGKTGLLDGAREHVYDFSRKTNAFTAVLLSSLVSSAIACSQALAIILTHQLCRNLHSDCGRLALDLEDSAVVTAPLFPWSIASAVPLAAADSPTAAILASFYLFLLPLCRLIMPDQKKRRPNHAL